MKRKGRSKKKIWLGLLCFLLVAVILLTAGGVLLILPYSKATMDLSLLTLCEEGEPAVLYVRDPQAKGAEDAYRPIAEGIPQGMRRQILTDIEALPEDLVNAFVAIEDKRFFEHEGVDLRRTLHAAWDYVTQKGEATFGGSSITQQLVKNLTGNTDRTPRRKLTEIFTALDLERQVDKETILEVYLNVINLGEGCLGVGAAADCYFGKAPSELSLCECAALAAITNNPTYYDPRVHPENNEKRRRLILREMRDQGYISEERYAEAVDCSLTLCDEKKPTAPMTTWYTEMVMADVLRDLQARLGYSYEKAVLLLSHGGLRIETAMNEAVQDAVTEYYENAANFPVGTNGRPESAMLIMDPYSGEILAVAGAIGKKEAYYLQNYATQTKRPAGSAIKPLSVYAPALKEGLITWGSVFEDAPSEEKHGRPWPKNADGLYRGRVTVRDSVAHSLNTVSVEVLKLLGLETSFAFLHDTLHMESLLSAEGEAAHDLTLSSLALGQQSYGVTVRELTAAYTIFANGVYHAPISYRCVLDSEGRVLLENKTEGERVLTEEEACIMTRLLETVTTDGTASNMRLREEGILVAGKTGTTQNNCDRWFVGYTPRLLCGVWMGYDYPMPLDGIDGNPAVWAFDDVISACEDILQKDAPKSSFDPHERVISVRICPLSGEIATPECYAAMGAHHLPEVGWFVEGTEPRDCCHLHFSLWQADLPQEGTADEGSPAEDETSEAEKERVSDTAPGLVWPRRG